VLTLTAGIGANFTVNVITTTSASFATGTNRLREVSVASGSSSVVTIPGAGTAYTNVLLVPVNVSPGIERVAFSYQAHVQVQATPPRLPYAKRINSGGGAYVDSRGQTWEADRPYATGGAGYVNGSSSSVAPGAGATGDAAVYQNERWGMTAYKLDVPNGVYTVTLKFAEHYFARAGMRLFDVRIENQAALTNFDIFQSAGGRGLGVDRTFVVNVTDGNLTILFVPRRGHATICGLAVVSGAP
jgi:hypothetical protein